jgi:hypothetical protein
MQNPALLATLTDMTACSSFLQAGSDVMITMEKPAG